MPTCLKLYTEKPSVKTLQMGLAYLGHHCGFVDGFFGPKTEAALVAFQHRVRLRCDGILGLRTVKAYNEYLTKTNNPEALLHRLTHIQMPTKQKAFNEPELKMSLHQTHCNGQWFHMRSDAAHTFQDSVRALSAKGMAIHLNPSYKYKKLSFTTRGSTKGAACFAFLGLQWELDPKLGMQDARKDPYVITFANNRPWDRTIHVWMRVNASQAPRRKLKALVAKETKNTLPIPRTMTYTYTQHVEGHFFNLTEYMKGFGFSTRPLNPGFANGFEYALAGWWQFFYTFGMKKHKTRFGDLLLKIRPKERIEKHFKHWDTVKCYRWGSEWV